MNLCKFLFSISLGVTELEPKQIAWYGEHPYTYGAITHQPNMNVSKMFFIPFRKHNSGGYLRTQRLFIIPNQ